ncbi:MAG: hypothetical protein D6766_07925 [Verrucomicrobia bacterium]|nr:MAG: hypothetical protein D6766_07925 [Verrucomicrobiota bacterium]
MTVTKQQVLDALVALREGRIPLDAFIETFNCFSNEGILGAFESVEARRVSEFIRDLDTYDPHAQPCHTFWECLKAEWKAACGEPAYTKDIILQEAFALEQCLLGKESPWQRLRRFFSLGPTFRYARRRAMINCTT